MLGLGTTTKRISKTLKKIIYDNKTTSTVKDFEN
jgi:hypothetical protein